MGEDLSDVIRNGFDTYRHNLKISIPFLLYLLLIAAMLIPTALLLLIWGVESEELMPLWTLVFLLAMALGSLFWAGMIGMAREANLKGKTFLKNVWIDGKAHWFQVFIANVGILVILMIIALVLIYPLFIVRDATGSFISFLVFFVPVILIFFLFAIALVNIVPVSIVVDNLGAFEGIKRGIGFIRSNKRYVLLISLLYLAASIAIELAVVIIIFGASAIFGFEDAIFSESEEASSLLSISADFIELVVLYPLFFVLWTRLYMARTGRLDKVGIEIDLQETPEDQSEDRKETQKEDEKKET